MVWITKRELAYYFVLKNAFQDRVFNLGEAFDILILFGSKRVARKIVKKLMLLGFLEKVGDINYRVKELEPALLASLREYIVQRIYKRIKLLGFNVDIVTDNTKKKLVVQNCDERLQAVISMLDDIIHIECIKVV